MGKVDPLLALWTQSTSSLRCPDPVSVLPGIPEGSVLGPILILIFINDFPDNVKASVRLFADDCVLFYERLSILQENFDSLAHLGGRLANEVCCQMSLSEKLLCGMCVRTEG